MIQRISASTLGDAREDENIDAQRKGAEPTREEKAQKFYDQKGTKFFMFSETQSLH